MKADEKKRNRTNPGKYPQTFSFGELFAGKNY